VHGCGINIANGEAVVSQAASSVETVVSASGILDERGYEAINFFNAATRCAGSVCAIALSQTVCSLATGFGLFCGAAAGFVFTGVFLGFVCEKAAGTSRQRNRLITRDLINTSRGYSKFYHVIAF